MARNLTKLDEYIPQELIGLRQPITLEEFEELCANYRDLRLELTSTGELIAMPPTGAETGKRNFNLIGQLAVWFRQTGIGVCFDSDSGFILPNGAVRSPDLAWVTRGKWDRLTDQQKKRFAPWWPDFVVELRSPTDRLSEVRNKMAEYMETGASLGWLIDPGIRQVYVFRPNEELIV